MMILCEVLKLPYEKLVEAIFVICMAVYALYILGSIVKYVYVKSNLLLFRIELKQSKREQFQTKINALSIEQLREYRDLLNAKRQVPTPVRNIVNIILPLVSIMGINASNYIREILAKNKIFKVLFNTAFSSNADYLVTAVFALCVVVLILVYGYSDIQSKTVNIVRLEMIKDELKDRTKPKKGRDIRKEEEKEWLDMMAKFHGVTLTTLLKEYSMSDLEDQYDVMTAEVAHKEFIESGKKSSSLEEVSKALDLE